jgi:hypothetical protein
MEKIDWNKIRDQRADIVDVDVMERLCDEINRAMQANHDILNSQCYRLNERIAVVEKFMHDFTAHGYDAPPSPVIGVKELNKIINKIECPYPEGSEKAFGFNVAIGKVLKTLL